MDVERFAKRLEPLARACGENAVVLCPEGLSRFYWGGFDGPPVASWMTRAERLSEIADFCDYLDGVRAHALEQAPNAGLRLLGFSQGVATVLRWMQARRPDFEHLVIWSGTPPEDLDYEPREYFATRKISVRWGLQDELVPWSRAAARFDEVPLELEPIFYDGGHALSPNALLDLVATLSSLQ